MLLCAVAGAGVAAILIYTHTGPGVRPLPLANTPARRNFIRTSELKTLMSALQTYYKDNGSLPTTLPTIATQICTNYGSNCVSKHLVDLGFLTTAGDYIEGVPQDPLGGKGLWGSGFYIARLPDGTVQITAPEAEAGKAVQDTAQL